MLSTSARPENLERLRYSLPSYFRIPNEFDRCEFCEDELNYTTMGTSVLHDSIAVCMKSLFNGKRAKSAPVCKYSCRIRSSMGTRRNLALRLVGHFVFAEISVDFSSPTYRNPILVGKVMSSDFENDT